MATAYFDDYGIRFEYPTDWEVEVIEDGARTTVNLQSPGPAFAFVLIDETCSPPAIEADQALEAMKEEYPNLEASPALETIDGHPAVGHDLEFFSLDIIVSCAIRCFRTPRRTVLIFAQWSDLEGEESEMSIRALRGSLEESDSGPETD
jgi:hypothetical protein